MKLTSVMASILVLSLAANAAPPARGGGNNRKTEEKKDGVTEGKKATTNGAIGDNAQIRNNILEVIKAVATKSANKSEAASKVDREAYRKVISEIKDAEARRNAEVMEDYVMPLWTRASEVGKSVFGKIIVLHMDKGVGADNKLLKDLNRDYVDALEKTGDMDKAAEQAMALHNLRVRELNSENQRLAKEGKIEKFEEIPEFKTLEEFINCQSLLG